jgi:hypothetical protein
LRTYRTSDELHELVYAIQNFSEKELRCKIINKRGSHF